MIIDYVNIALTGVIGVLFVLIMFLRSDSGVIFPLIFFAGGTVNFLHCLKRFMDRRRLAGAILAAAALILYIMSAACWVIAV